MEGIGVTRFAHGRVLLLGGISGTGKTTAAREIAHRSNVDWVQVDDLRLALQWSQARLPSEEATDSLHYFLRQANVWEQPAERLRDALIGVGEAMKDAIAIVASHHVAKGGTTIIEGDGILPSIVDHPMMRPLVQSRQVMIAFVLAPSREEILDRIHKRSRGVDEETPAERDRIAEMNWLYAGWLRAQANAFNLPVLPPEPLDSLAQRVEHLWIAGRGG